MRRSRRHITMMRALALACVGVVCMWAAGGLLSGCNTRGCTDNRSALPMMGFYSMSTGSQIMLDSLEMRGVGAPGDSLLIAKGESRAWVYLPFRFDDGETTFIMHYAYPGLDSPALDDVVTFRYVAEPFFASEECGAYYIYRITGVDYTRHLIDSIAVSDSVITNVDIERIKVFFRTMETDTPDEGEEKEVSE